ncbi:hypothetical protein [Candidatus Spongiisocius sp.]|uniref:hypothetical protein n=1 Tax=Candidatus Spongiisocius sp. TaxID=3101273 RepID=UPI003B5A151D
MDPSDDAYDIVLDDPHNLVLTDLMGLWADRANRLHEQREATTAFRLALRAAVEDDKVPVTAIAEALDISRRGVGRHLTAARSLPDTS